MGISRLVRRLALIITAALLMPLGLVSAPTAGAAAGALTDPPAVGLRLSFPSSAGGFTSQREPATWSASGGNPDGYVSGEASVETSPRWTGNRSAAYGGRISFDVRVAGEPRRNFPIAIDMTNGQELIGAGASVPSGEWTTVSLPVTPGAGRYHQDRGPDSDDPTPDEFRSVLRDLRGISFPVPDRADVGIDLDNSSWRVRCLAARASAAPATGSPGCWPRRSRPARTGSRSRSCG